MRIRPEQARLLFQKILKGTATEKESIAFISYLQEHTGTDDDLLMPYEEWKATGETELPDMLKERVLKRILQQAPGKQEMTAVTRRRKISRWIYRAAVILLLITAGYGLSRYKQVHHRREWITFTARNGQQRKITLPDSSTVYLNAGSRITFPAGFSDQERIVKLSGEAFFEVVHAPDEPFLVLSDSVSTTVLGTSFNIKAYPEEKDISVTVTSGKVRVTAGKTGAAVLLPGQGAAYIKEGRTLRINETDAAAVSGWKDNRLVFEDATLQDICTVLERRYNVSISTAAPAMLNSIYSITFDQLTLEGSLEKLALIGDIKVIRKDNKIILGNRP